jgi:hypothetical protein
MKIKHYVITRFLSSTTLGLGDMIFDESIIQNGLSYVRSYFIPSMNNQTVKDFTVIFMINENHDTQNSGIKELYDLQLDMPFVVLPHDKYFKYIKEDSADADWVILTRMDYDDLVYKKAAEEVQDLVRSNDSQGDIFTYGYNTGMILYENQLYTFPKTNYWKQGYFSIFESVCVRRSELTSDINIYSLSHPHLKSEVCKYAADNGLTFISEQERESFDNFVWVRHENTGTELLSGFAVSKDRLNTSLPEFDNDTFKDLFGRNLPN